MEDNKEKDLEEESVEETTQIPEMAQRQMENYIYLKEMDRKAKEETHRENMKDLNYRRWYYQDKIQKHMDMIPREYYYQAEYEEMETLSEKYIKKIDSLEDEKDMEALLKEFRRKTSKKLDSNKIISILLIIFFAAFIGLMIYLFNQ